MSLTEDEKKKIEQEEFYRAEIRNKKDATHPGKPRSCVAWGCISVLALFFLSSLLSALHSDKNTNAPSTTTPPISRSDLQGTVNVEDGQIKITNTEDRDWELCELSLNGKYNYPTEQGLWGSETPHIGKIESHGDYTVGTGQFTLSNGERFNVYSTKPLDIVISCENGMGYWAW